MYQTFGNLRFQGGNVVIDIVSEQKSKVLGGDRDVIELLKQIDSKKVFNPMALFK